MKTFPVIQSLTLLLFLTGVVLLTEATKERGSAANAILQAQPGIHHMQKRQSLPSRPTGPCTEKEEGHVSPIPANSDQIWICKRGQWAPFELSPSTGSFNYFPGRSCKHIKQDQCSAQNGTYWVKLTGQCPEDQNQTMQVYCDMHTDGGGWSLVWKHSYLEVSPLTRDMYYHSDFFKPCTDLTSGWCNIPSKIRFQPEEMMIAAYHDNIMVYAYKGIFNRNLDYHWTGATLLGNMQIIIDQCTRYRSVPKPIQHNDLTGMIFDKQYSSDGDTLQGTLSSPYDERWEECRLPLSISFTTYNVQMTMAIYVR